MTMTQIASILPPGETTYFNANGVPLAGGSVYYYVPNTLTLKNTWQDPYGSVLNTNPVILDAAGRCTVYGEGQYTQAVYDSLGNLQYTALTQDLLQLFNLPATTRVALSANQAYYVSTTGSDSTGTGTSGNPWATPNHALNYIATLIDLRGWTATVNVADGTYTTPTIVQGPFVGQGTVLLQGDTATPSNCILHTTSADCIAVSEGAVLQVSGFTLETTTTGNGLVAYNGGQIYSTGSMIFGACAYNHAIASGPGSLIGISSNYTITGGADAHWYVQNCGAQLIAQNLTITLTGTPAFSTAFAVAEDAQLNAVSNTFTGSATGNRFNISANGFIKTGTNSLTYFPGSSAGITTTGGVYNTLASSPLQAVAGTVSDLVIAWATDSTVDITAAAVALVDSTSDAFVATSVSLVLNAAASGANGLDTGSLAPSTWYYIYIIYNATTVASLMSLSATSPTLPSGYTYKARVGALRTDGSSNVIGFTQKSKSAQYQVGSNLTGLPQMASGSAGSISAPTWVTVAVASYIPPTAAKITVVNYADAQGVIVAPNSSYGAYNSTSNPPFQSNFPNGNINIQSVEFVLESSDIYWASNTSNAALYCGGWEDNL